MPRCALCPGKNKCVQPHGPRTKGSTIFLGEAPGSVEDDKGVPFWGKTGQEVNDGYMPLAGFQRPKVLVHNAISCLPISAKGKLDYKKAADRDLLYSCAETNLYPMLEELRPKLIVAMGVFACKSLNPDIDLDLQHGFPVETSFGTVFPMYHPAGGVHEPKKMLHIRTDWVRLRKYTRGVLVLPDDPFAAQEDYRELVHPDDVHGILHGNWDKVLSNDTENTRKKKAFCYTFSLKPGTGYLVRAENDKALKAVQTNLDQWKGSILWHNWLHDDPITAQMKLTFPRHLIIDTMVEAFHLGNIPQGLKALSKRLCGMSMMDFDDVVTPHSTRLVLEYYRNAYTHEWGKPEAEIYRDKDGSWKQKQPQGMNTKLKRFFTDYEKNTDKDVFETWTKNWEESQEMIEAVCGEWPGKCITHAAEVDWPTVLWYACRDADALLRVWKVILMMLARVRKKPQEAWGDL